MQQMAIQSCIENSPIVTKIIPIQPTINLQPFYLQLGYAIIALCSNKNGTFPAVLLLKLFSSNI
jgi:hypothetical protein